MEFRWWRRTTQHPWWWRPRSPLHHRFRWWRRNGRRTTSHRRRGRRNGNSTLSQRWRRTAPVPEWWRRTYHSAGATTSTAAADTGRRTVAISATLTIRAAGIFFDVHFLESGMTPTVRILFLNLQKLLIPRFVGKSSSLSHYVVDFLALSSWVAGIYELDVRKKIRVRTRHRFNQYILTIDPSMGRLTIHAQFTGTSAPSA